MSFNAGWETTGDDVLNVVHKMGKKASGEVVEKILEELDQFSIEDAALYGESTEEQTRYAYEEIEKQIKEKGLL